MIRRLFVPFDLRSVLAALFLVTLSGAALVQSINPLKVAAAKQASDEFAKLAAGSHQTGKPPRQSDPKVKALLDTAFDLTPVPTNRPLSFSEKGKVAEWQYAIIRVGFVYLLSGTGVDDFSKAVNNPLITAQGDRNVVDFAPEYGRYLGAHAGILRIVLTMFNAYLGANAAAREQPDFKRGLQNVQWGAVQSFGSALTTIALPGLSNEWRRARMPATLILAPHLAQDGDPDTVKQLQAMTAELGKLMTEPALQADLNRLAAALTR